jgi:hypothetical protein
MLPVPTLTAQAALSVITHDRADSVSHLGNKLGTANAISNWLNPQAVWPQLADQTSLSNLLGLFRDVFGISFAFVKLPNHIQKMLADF